MKTIFSFLVITLLLLAFPLYPQWALQSLPGDIDVTLGIDFIDQNHGVMGGWHFNFGGQIFGNAFYTTNSGTNWFESNFPDSMRVIVSVQMFDSLIAYGAGAYNSSINPKCPTTNLNKKLNPTIKKYYELLGMEYSTQEDYRGYFLETTDGGLTWHPKGSFEDSVYYLVGSHFFDLQTGFVLATGPYNNTYSAILKTTDDGNNWNYVYEFEAYLFLNEIKFFNQLIGFAVGTYDDATDSYGVVLKTTNGGDSWIRTELPQLISLSSVTFLDINSILISGTKTNFVAAIFRSDDGGITWYECCTYSDTHTISGINSLPASGVIIVYGQKQEIGFDIPFIEVTLDGGVTWYYDFLTQWPDYYFTKSKLIDDSRWYITGSQQAQMGFVLITDNSGGVPVELVSFTAEFVESQVNLKWTTASELNNSGFEIERASSPTTPGQEKLWRTIGFIKGKGTSTEIQNYIFTDDLFEVAVSKLFYRLKQIDFDGSYEYSNEVEVDVSIANAETFSLFQNYPNPFNSSTTIAYGLQEDVFVSLIVYDCLGENVQTLVNEFQEAGTHRVVFESSNLPSGIYFLRIVTDNWKETKRMVFLK